MYIVRYTFFKLRNGCLSSLYITRETGAAVEGDFRAAQVLADEANGANRPERPDEEEEEVEKKRDHSINFFYNLRIHF